MLKSTSPRSGKDIVPFLRQCKFSTCVSPGVQTMLLIMLTERSEVNMHLPYVFVLYFYLAYHEG